MRTIGVMDSPDMAEAIFLTNSLMGLRAVSTIDGRPQQPTQVTTLLMRGRR